MIRNQIAPAALAVGALVSSAFGGLSPDSGWRANVAPAAPAGSFVGGMDYLPNGNLAIFDGAAIVEVDPADGSVLQTLYTPPTPVFGSFLQASPDGTFLLFGESSLNEIVRVPLDGSPPSVVTKLVFNFDLTFESNDVAYVSAAPSFGTTQIFRLELANGATDLIADLQGSSGPVTLDASDNLYYATNSLMFPPPVGEQNVLRFTAAQVAGAIGPTFLTEADAQTFVPNRTNPFDMVFDEEGELLVGEGADGEVFEFSAGGDLNGRLGAEGAFVNVGALAFRGNGAAVAQFAPYQPDDGGRLAVISTDFFSFNDVTTLTPRRPALDSSPASPVPDGWFTVDLSAGPESGMALLMLATGGLDPELPVFSSGLPVFIGVDPGTLLASVLVPLDAAGSLSIMAENRPTVFGSVVLQTVVLDDGGDGAGTSTPLTLILQ